MYGNVEWWTTIESRNQMRVIAGTALKQPGLGDGDIDTFAEAFESLLMRRLVDSNFFDLGKLSGPTPATTLFDLIPSTLDKPTFGARLYSDFLAACKQKLCTWLTVYPLRRIHCVSTIQPIGGVRLIASNDNAAWDFLGRKFPEIQRLVPPFATFGDHRLSLDFDPDSAWVVCEHTGTARGAMIAAQRDIAAFLAVLFAFASSVRTDIWIKGGADRDRRCVQVADPNCQSNNWIVTSIGELMPPLMSAFVVDAKLLADVGGWFAKASAHPNSNRAATAAAFLHHAIRNDGLERFVNLFVVLDGLFGAKHKVEAGVLAGISKVFPGDATWRDKCGALYDLRNAVVHGACSDLDRWVGLEDYVKQFESWPSVDAVQMSTASLISFVDIPPPSPEPTRGYWKITHPIAEFLQTISKWIHKL